MIQSPSSLSAKWSSNQTFNLGILAGSSPVSDTLFLIFPRTFLNKTCFL